MLPALEWTPAVIQRLRALWAEGHSTAEIGRRLGVSKNAVVGKAHRLELPARPSPIRRDGTSGPSKPRVRRVTGPTLAPLACLQMPLPRAPVVAAAPAPLIVALRHVKANLPAAYRCVMKCCWPVGEPGTRAFRYCEDPSLPGKPYCAEHADKAYVRPKDRREEGATL